jgi:hypothetical protein
MRTIASRIAAVFTILTGIIAIPTGAAFASVPAPDPQTAAAAVTTDAVVTTSTRSGLNVWAVAAIALVAIVVGVVLSEVAHRVSRRRNRSLVTA